MSEWRTIRVPEEAYQTAQSAKSDRETWGEYLSRCANEPVAIMTEADIRRITKDEIESNVVENARL